MRIIMNKKHPYFFISLYGWTYWLPILAAGGLITATLATALAAAPEGSAAKLCLIAVIAIVVVLTLAGLAFFRDFPRQIPNAPGVMVSPADGKVSEISKIDYFAPFNGPALKISIFLSVLDVHVNRAPCAGVVASKVYEEGLFLDARHPECSAKNQSATIIIAESSQNAAPVAAVKQLVGAIARRIITPVEPGFELERGQRYGMIAFGSRTELYVPNPEKWEVVVPLGKHVKGAAEVLIRQK